MVKCRRTRFENRGSPRSRCGNERSQALQSQRREILIETVERLRHVDLRDGKNATVERPGDQELVAVKEKGVHRSLDEIARSVFGDNPRSRAVRAIQAKYQPIVINRSDVNNSIAEPNR